MTADTVPAPPDALATVRLAEVLAALSLATDAGNGFPLDKSLPSRGSPNAGDVRVAPL